MKKDDAYILLKELKDSGNYTLSQTQISGLLDFFYRKPGKNNHGSIEKEAIELSYKGIDKRYITGFIVKDGTKYISDGRMLLISKTELCDGNYDRHICFMSELDVKTNYARNYDKLRKEKESIIGEYILKDIPTMKNMVVDSKLGFIFDSVYLNLALKAGIDKIIIRTSGIAEFKKNDKFELYILGRKKGIYDK